MSQSTVRVDIEGLCWPAPPDAPGRLVPVLLRQFEDSQWWAPDELRRRQFEQLDALLRHASATVPHYGARLAAAGYRAERPLTDDLWMAVPRLSRQELQAAGDSMVSVRIPASHGPTKLSTTSGSTGRPVSVLKAALLRSFLRANTIRNHLWQRHDFAAKMAAIRNLPDGEAEYPDGTVLLDWGAMTRADVATGPSALLAITATIDQQVEWLTRHQPDYLLTFPSVALELLRYCQANGGGPQRLRQVITIAETVSPELRRLCREVWDASLADIYSSQEVGVMALQCPASDGYHAMSESVLLEVLDDGGRPCAPGEVGRLVVTALHNFAQPIIRYEIGDYAEAGGSCGCGRGLPLVNRILGRMRNMLTLPDGRVIWPRLSEMRYRELAPIRQYQVVQRSRERLEMRLATDRPLTAEEEANLRALILARIGHPGFDVVFSYTDHIERSAGGKYEDFRSEV